MSNNSNIEWLEAEYKKRLEKAEIIRKAILELSENGKMNKDGSERIRKVLQKPLSSNNSQKYPEQALKITDAIRWAFENNMRKTLKAKDIVVLLEELRKRKLIDTESDDLSNAVGSPIKRLLRNGYIERIGGKKKKNVKYKKISA